MGLRGASRVLGVALFGACSGGASDAPIDATDPVDATSPAGAPVGRIDVVTWTDLDRGRTGASIRAEFGQARPPSQYEEDRLTEVARAGDCRVLQRLAGTCQATCEWACFPDGTCQHDRDLLDAGEVTVTGAGPAPIVTAYPYVPTSLPTLAAEVGALVRVEATGAVVPPLALEAPRPPPLALDVVGAVVRLRDDVPTVLRWTAAPDPAARFGLRIGSPYGHAGSSEFVLACDGPDVGAVSIDPTLVAAMPALAVPNCVGFSCRMAELRRSVDATMVLGSGHATLRVGDLAWFWAEH